MGYEDHQSMGKDLEFTTDRVPLEGQKFDHSFPLSWVGDHLVPGYAPAATPLHVSGAVKRSGHSFIVDVQFDVELEGECIRCLEKFNGPISGTFTHVFDSFAPENDEVADANTAGGISTIEDNKICLEPIVAEEFVLLIPAYPICTSDCAGLCSACGQNLNKAPCECEAAMDPRWAKLTSMKLDDSAEKENSSDDSPLFKPL